MTRNDTTTQKWLDDFTIALRLRGVDGRRMGDAVAQVETHLAESGETPAEAFGAPQAYAASLPLPDTSGGTPGLLRAMVPAVFIVMAVNLILSAATHWSTEVPLTVGHVLAALLFVAYIGAVALWPTRMLGSRALFMAGFMVAFVGMVVLATLVTHPLATMPPLGALVAGLVCALLAFLTRRLTGPKDPLVDPRR